MKKSFMASRWRMTRGLRTIKLDGETGADALQYLGGLNGRMPLVRHDDQEVHVGIVPRSTVGIRAEQDHALGPELPGQLRPRTP